MNQMRFDTRPANRRTMRAPDRGPKPHERPSRNGRGGAKPSAARSRNNGVLWIILAMVLFTVAYGGILLLKIQQEREVLVTEAERSQANAAKNASSNSQEV